MPLLLNTWVCVDAAPLSAAANVVVTAAVAVGTTTGSVTEKTVRGVAVSDRTAMVPPRSSTVSRTMASPRPDELAKECPSRVWLYSLKRVSMSACPIPGPLSVTSKRRKSCTGPSTAGCDGGESGRVSAVKGGGGGFTRSTCRNADVDEDVDTSVEGAAAAAVTSPVSLVFGEAAAAGTAVAAAASIAAAGAAAVAAATAESVTMPPAPTPPTACPSPSQSAEAAALLLAPNALPAAPGGQEGRLLPQLPRLS